MPLPQTLSTEHAEAILQWYIENGVDEALSARPVDRLAAKSPSIQFPLQPPAPKAEPVFQETVMATSSELKSEAVKLASGAGTLEELKAAISKFEGLSIKRTAMNMVFGSGYPKARVMVIGDAPEADDDRAGEAFSGEVGVLTDKMFAAIGLARAAQEVDKSIYLTYLLNWRPPGNRSPTAGEIELSLVFLLRHIELVAPQFLFLMGGIAGKSLLGNEETIARLRGKSHLVKLPSGSDIPALVTYSPSFLLRTPLKKKEAWDDLQRLKDLL